MNTFIIATHSTYAEGLYNCLKFFKNDIDYVHFINVYVEDTEFEKSFRNMVESLNAKNLIVLTDMPGGSVNQICTKLMNKYKYHLISGINFPLALELIFQVEEINKEMIQEIVESSKNQIVYVNEMFHCSEEEDEEL